VVLIVERYMFSNIWFNKNKPKRAAKWA